MPNDSIRIARRVARAAFLRMAGLPATIKPDLSGFTVEYPDDPTHQRYDFHGVSPFASKTVRSLLQRALADPAAKHVAKAGPKALREFVDEWVERETKGRYRGLPWIMHVHPFD